MKFLLTVVALATLAHAAPTTTHTMEIGANGAISGSATALQSIPLVEIIVNLLKDVPQTVAPGTAIQPADPVIVVDEAVNTEPVIVVDRPIIVVPELPEVNPIDVIHVNPVAPAPAPEAPAPIVLPQPVSPEVVPSPIVLPQPVSPEVVPSPIVLPQPVSPEVVPSPIVLPQPVPAEVAPAPIALPEPTPVEVVDAVHPVQVVDAADESAGAGSSQIINVIMSFIFGANGSLSSVQLPSNVTPQIQSRV